MTKKTFTWKTEGLLVSGTRGVGIMQLNVASFEKVVKCNIFLILLCSFIRPTMLMEQSVGQ